MNLIEQFKREHPEYNSVGDVALATALHRKFYPQVPVVEFYQRAGLLEKIDPTGSFGENFLAGTGMGMARLGRGVMQLAGKDVNEAEHRRLDAPLRSTAGGVIGDIVGTTAPGVALSMIPGANTIAGAAVIGGLTGGATPTTEGESRLANVGLGAAGGAAGQYLGGKAASALANRATRKAAELAALKSQNVARDATMQAGQRLGYALQPMEANPRSVLNQIVEGVGGKIQTGQAVAVQNQQVTNRLAREALGLPENAPITKSAIDKVRGELGKVYEALRGVGTFVPDEKFTGTLTAIKAESDKLAKFAPSLAKPEVGAVVDDFLKAQEIPSDIAVDAVKSLYEEAAGNLKFSASNGQKQLGRAQRKIANALQDLIESNLDEQGAGDMLTAFKEARKQYAQAMTLRRAVKEGSGNVAASKIAQELNKDVPLSGDLRTIAEFANAFPKATQVPAYQPGFSAADFLLSGPTAVGGAIATGGPLGALWGAVPPLARHAARGAALSPRFQSSLIPDYAVGALTRMSPEALKKLNPLLPSLGALAGMSVLPESP